MTLLHAAPSAVHYPAFKCLKDKRVILASTSPRRIEMFHRMGLKFEVQPSNFEEDYVKANFESPAAYCAATCLMKGKIVRDLTAGDENSPALIVSSDTIVVCEEEIFEKPTDRADAIRMLTQVSGRDIEVITAVTIFYRTAPGVYGQVSFEEVTVMHMDDYGLDMIEAYLETGEGMGNSGALTYQGASFLMVKGITGCLYSLIGFPAPRFHKEVLKISHLIV